MIYDDLVQLVKQLMIDKMKKKVAFTAVDIANELANDFDDINLSYVGEVINNNILNVSSNGAHMYEVTFIDGCPGYTTYDHLYHPFRYDISEYKNEPIKEVITWCGKL